GFVHKSKMGGYKTKSHQGNAGANPGQKCSLFSEQIPPIGHRVFTRREVSTSRVPPTSRAPLRNFAKPGHNPIQISVGAIRLTPLAAKWYAFDPTTCASLLLLVGSCSSLSIRWAYSCCQLNITTLADNLEPTDRRTGLTASRRD